MSNHITQCTPTTQEWEGTNNVVTANKVKWALKNFEHFKSAGLNGVFPALLQWHPEEAIKHLTLAKSIRPISLTSFLLKTLERLVDRHLWDRVLKNTQLTRITRKLCAYIHRLDLIVFFLCARYC